MSDRDAVTKAVLKAAVERDGRQTLACAEAFKVAAAMGVELTDVARICNHYGIKIVACQLGCFK